MWLKIPIIMLVYSVALNDSLQTTECLAKPCWLNNSLCTCSGWCYRPWKDAVENCLMMGSNFWYELEMRLWRWGAISIISLQTQPDVGFFLVNIFFTFYISCKFLLWISQKKYYTWRSWMCFVHIATHVSHGIAEYRIENTCRYDLYPAQTRCQDPRRPLWLSESC